MYEEILSPEHVAVARELFRRIERYVLEKDLPWTPVFREWWLGFQRPGQYYVPVITLRREKPITFAVKIQDDPTKLGLNDPYPELDSHWDGANRQWTWAIPSPGHVPDVSGAWIWYFHSSRSAAHAATAALSRHRLRAAQESETEPTGAAPEGSSQAVLCLT
jgi:hypothetical protein